MASPQVTDPTIDADAGPPAGRPPRRPLPTWARRTAMVAILALAAGLLVVSYRIADKGGTTKDRDPVIVIQSPPPGGTAPRQTTVGAELKVGYDGRLTVNGVAIPESQMEGARDPRTVSAEDLAANGLRPNNHHRVFFTPGPGKVFEKFEPGDLRISVQYFKDRQSRDSGRTVSWTVRVV